MSSFVAQPPVTIPAPADLVAGDGFWPDMSITAFKDAMRMGKDITIPRARDALRAGMIHVRRELATWQVIQISNGCTSLANVPGGQVDGETIAALLYRRAVFCIAAADLVETHHTISATGDGRDRAEEQASAADDLRRDATHAIRDILGVTRTTVDLV